LVKHPLDHIPLGALRRCQLPSVAVAALCIGALPLILPLRETHTLLDLVEAGTVEAAAAVLEHWSNQERVRLAYAVGLDFLMNPAYMNVLAISCIWSGRRLRTLRARGAASIFAWLCWSVALTNAAENVGLFVALSSGPRDPWPGIVAFAHYWAGLVVLLAGAFSVAGMVRRAA